VWFHGTVTKIARSPEQVFRLFIERAERMASRRIFIGGVPKVSYKMTLGGARYKFELTAPDEEDFRSFLLDLRPFLMEKESINFNRVAADLHRRLADEHMRADCVHNRDGWKRVMKGEEIFDIDGVKYEAKDLFFMVAYSELFHLDSKRRDEFARLPRSVQDIANYNVYSFGLKAAQVIVPQANLIRKALKVGAVNLDPR